MTTANIDTKKLREVSKLLWAIISDFQSKKYKPNEYLSTSDGGYEIQVRDLFTIAATMLKLVEENEIKDEIIECYRLLRSGYKYGKQDVVDTANDIIRIAEDKLKDLAAQQGDPHEKG